MKRTGSRQEGVRRSNGSVLTGASLHGRATTARKVGSMSQYRTEPQSSGGGLDVVRVLALVCLLPIFGPPLLLGAVWLLVWL